MEGAAEEAFCSERPSFASWTVVSPRLQPGSERFGGDHREEQETLDTPLEKLLQQTGAGRWPVYIARAPRCFLFPTSSFRLRIP